MSNPRPVAFFDFDGTLSRIRSGWQTVMADHMLEVLLGTAVAAAAHPALSERVADAIEGLSGRPTILQMEWLVAEVEQRGGRALPAADYKEQFADHIGERVEARVQALQLGSAQPADLLVPGAAEFLALLRQRDVQCYIGSGSDEAAVRAEAQALGIAGAFAGIYGAWPDNLLRDKHALVAQVLAESGCSGAQLFGFGDGAIDMQAVCAAGGFAIGVAFNELAGAGPDAGKRERLLAAGAHLVVTDYTAAAPLLQAISGQPAAAN